MIFSLILDNHVLITCDLRMKDFKILSYIM